MFRTFLLLFFVFSFSLSSSQVYKQSVKGYWESGYWKKILKSSIADSNSSFTIKYPNGNIRLEGAFKKGVPAGTWKHYYKSGEKAAEVHYSGTYQFWLKNQCLSRVGEYKNGSRTGIWREYYYFKYYQCDSLKYYSIYDFDKARETWYNYKKKGEEETDFLDPYFYNKDLNHYYHRFTDFNYGIFSINTTLLNLSLLDDRNGIPTTHNTFGVSQSLSARRITSFDIRAEYRWSAPNTFTNETGSFETSFNQFLLSFGGDLIKPDVVDVFPFVGFGLGKLSLDYTLNPSESASYFRYAGQVNLMLENRLNLKPYTAKWGASFGVKAGYILEAGGTNWIGNPVQPSLIRNKLAGYYLLGIVGLYY